IAVPEAFVSLLANDQCGVTAQQRTSSIGVLNAGRGRLTASAQVLQAMPTGPAGLGGAGGAGGGIPGGGGVIIIVPPAPPGTPVELPSPVLPGGTQGAQNTAIAANSPQVRTLNALDGPQLDFTFTTAASARTAGTVSP